MLYRPSCQNITPSREVPRADLCARSRRVSGTDLMNSSATGVLGSAGPVYDRSDSARGCMSFWWSCRRVNARPPDFIFDTKLYLFVSATLYNFFELRRRIAFLNAYGTSSNTPYYNNNRSNSNDPTIFSYRFTSSAFSVITEGLFFESLALTFVVFQCIYSPL